jgi:AcrR family transcriptional regulator
VVAGSQSTARERVLAVAEELFSERGYAAVTLRDIADALGIRQASLYHHVPGGKEELFVEVTERGLARHQASLERVISEADPDSLKDQLRAAARWLLSQPPVDLARMIRSDMPAISDVHARRLTQAALRSLVMPIERAFAAARVRGVHQMPYERLLAGSLLSIIETIRVSERYSSISAETMVDLMIDILVDGLRVH